MSLDKLKKQAKNLQRLLPEFISEHPNELRLGDCQELVARIYGFPNWHAASVRALANEPPPPMARGVVPTVVVLPISIDAVVEEVVEYTEAGGEKRPREHTHLRIETNSAIDAEISKLDDFMETSGWRDWEVPPVELSERMLRLCEQLIARQPAFLDGHAHLAVALMHLGRHDEVIARLLPIYEAIVAAFPEGKRFKGRIPYYALCNRPFHRIGANLVVSAYELGTTAGDKLGSAIAKQMHRWWPNDNIGFRFILTAENFASQGE